MIDPQQIDPHQLPSTPLAKRAKLPEIPGIYFAIDRAENIQYIGRSRNINQRWISHHRTNELKEMRGVRIAYMKIVDVESLPEIETALIQHFEPLLNGISIPVQSQLIFDEIFREILKEEGITNRAIAKEVGVSEKHISQFKNGRADIPCSLLWKLIDACDRLSPGARLKFIVLMAGSLDSDKAATLLSLMAESMRSPS